MPVYQAPIRDMQFILNDVLQCEQNILQFPDFSEFNQELVDVVLDSAGKFCENELFPLNHVGDQQGCTLTNGEVKTPDGFKQAYQAFVENGWPALSADPQYGGQGLPKTVQLMIEEMVISSNVAFSLYSCLTYGVCLGIQHHADQALKDKYLPKLVSGQWAGTMCLTESHCGSDLGLLRSKATPNDDDSYSISGTKIFITSGEHDLTDNIIHLVLARLPDAPEGVKGISLFLVPKFIVNDDGSLGDRNPVYCASLEHKMGIKGSSTCVMNFDNAKGFLVGEPHRGLFSMFTVMNIERLNIGLEGLALAETAYQNALQYAKERVQGRSSQSKEKSPEPILVHPDVRRMLLTIKAFTEGSRAFSAWTGMQIDIAAHHPDAAQRDIANGLVALMTPVVKAYFTDTGFEACNHALQVFGGHGYIAETGVEQYVRDARIAQIYEGTNGIQALDLVRRKVIFDQGKMITHFMELVQSFINDNKSSEFAQPCADALARLKHCTNWLLDNAASDVDGVNAAATDYLKLFALTINAYFWAQMAVVANDKIAQDKTFYEAKLHTARFFMQRVLPQTLNLEQSICAGAESIMAMQEDMF